MSIELEVSLDRDIREMEMFFSNLKFKALTLATRQALNRTALRARGNAIKEIAKRKKLKQKEIKARTPIRKATGTNITNLESSIKFSGLSLPLILFILGQKTPKPQTAPNPRRKPRKFEVSRGRKKAKPGLFIQRAKRGDQPYQVFRRRKPSDKTNRRFVKQASPSIAEFLDKKRSILGKIENTAIAIMQREFDRAVKFQLDKLK